MTPYTVGKYEIRRELGRGAMGVVYEAHDLSQGIDVALKVMAGTPGTTEQRRSQQRRFDREAKVLARLNHPRVVRLFEQGQLNGRHYFAMELVRGTTLRDRLRFQGPLSGPEVTRLALELCDALEHLRFHEVVHRDIKPENLMLLPDGSVMLMDFGVAWAGSESEGTSSCATGFQGSPSYMSPEQVAGHPVDHRSDIYSLAVTLYEAATGRRAVEGESIPEITHKVATEYPLPPAGLPPFFQTILLRAMAKDPASRYSTAAELASDLRAGRTPILGPMPIVAPQPAAIPVVASMPRTFLGAAPDEVTAASPLMPPPVPPASLENWMPPSIPLRPPPPPPSDLVSAPRGQVGSSTEPGAGVLPCRLHPTVAGIARCGECGNPLCYHCLLETPARGVICRACGFREQAQPGKRS